MTVTFRNVDATPSDQVRTWPIEGLETVIKRGLVPDWKPVLDEIRLSPWGPVARRVEHYSASRASDSDAAAVLFALAIEHARSKHEEADRTEVAARVRAAIASTGLSNIEFARLVGTSASRLSTYRSGQVIPSAAMLVRIERVAAQALSR